MNNVSGAGKGSAPSKGAVPSKGSGANKGAAPSKASGAKKGAGASKRTSPKKGLVFELPEVETVRHDLERELIGKKVKAAEAASMKCLSRYRNRRSFTEQLEKAKIVGVERAGLHIVIGLDSGLKLVAGLGSTGSLRRNANKNPVLPGTELIISFTQHGQLRFVDRGPTGDLFVVPEDSLEAELPEIARYGFDPVTEPMPWTEFGRRVLARSVKLKRLLIDDTFVTGLRDVYADEILFEAGLRYDRMSNTLTSQEIRRLHRALVGTVHDAIKYRGTSLPEREFCDPFGETGAYAAHLQVWGRHGELSMRSRTPIKRVKFAGSWTYYCDTQV